jgi:hypothetical protein
MSGPEPARPTHALRVILRFKGTELVDARAQRVEMQTPPSDPISDLARHVGSWFDLSDANARVLYRRTIAEPLQSVEAPTADSDQTVVRKTVEDLRKSVVLLMPDLGSGSRLLVVRQPPGQRQPRQEWSFNLADLIT